MSKPKNSKMRYFIPYFVPPHGGHNAFIAVCPSDCAVADKSRLEWLSRKEARDTGDP